MLIIISFVYYYLITYEISLENTYYYYYYDQFHPTQNKFNSQKKYQYLIIFYLQQNLHIFKYFLNIIDYTIKHIYPYTILFREDYTSTSNFN